VDPPRCNIRGMDIRILNTTDGQLAKNFRLLVFGCYAPSDKHYMAIATPGTPVDDTVISTTNYADSTIAVKMCETIEELVQFGDTVLYAIYVNGIKLKSAIFPTPFPLTTIPTIVDFEFLQPAIIDHVSAMDPSMSVTEIAVETDSTPYIYSQNASSPTVNFHPNLDMITAVTVNISKTLKDSLPRNVRIGIYGCVEKLKWNTKAQIEEGTTAPLILF
ncbi:unnamed protein product, partial [Didymodactylos carnosus]